jgi:flagellar protein FlbD
LNPDHIICIEETPDTVITLFNGNKYIVVDRADTIISRIVTFRSRISRRAASHSAKKYLARNRVGQFHCHANISEETFGNSPDERKHTPFHSRDY